jgi:hypothetical protein
MEDEGAHKPYDTTYTNRAIEHQSTNDSSRILLLIEDIHRMSGFSDPTGL